MASDDQASSDFRAHFVAMLTGEQTRLFSYITTLVGDVNDASNILQQTNVVLWQKAEEFVPGTAFFPWAQKIAYYSTLSFLRDRKRDRHIFDMETLQQIAAAPVDPGVDERRVALRHCLNSLSEESRELVQQRYGPGVSISQMAQRTGKSEGSVRMALMRIRIALAGCIQRQMEASA